MQLILAYLNSQIINLASLTTVLFAEFIGNETKTISQLFSTGISCVETSIHGQIGNVTSADFTGQ